MAYQFTLTLGRYYRFQVTKSAYEPQLRCQWNRKDRFRVRGKQLIGTWYYSDYSCCCEMLWNRNRNIFLDAKKLLETRAFGVKREDN